MRVRLKAAGVADADRLSDEEIQARGAERARTFLEEAPTTAAQAAKIILDGVKVDRWRILVGEDAHELDERVLPTTPIPRNFSRAWPRRSAGGWADLAVRCRRIACANKIG